MLLCNHLKCLEVNRVYHTSRIDHPENHVDLQCEMPASNCLSYITQHVLQHLHLLNIYMECPFTVHFFFLRHSTLYGLSMN